MIYAQAHVVPLLWQVCPDGQFLTPQYEPVGKVVAPPQAAAPELLPPVTTPFRLVGVEYIE